MSFFEELKRRNVFKVGIAYLIGAWLLLQIADVVLNNIAAPGWVFKAIMLVVGIGLPIALFFAWAFEMTPDGVKRESEIDRSQSMQQKSGQKLNLGITAILVVALAYFVWESRFDNAGSESISAQSVGQSEITGEKLTLTPSKLTPSAQASVAVLPFINMSSDSEQEYFSDGITEEIINALVKIPGLSVPARTSVFGFKGHQGDVRKIGEQLDVAHVLEGSIRTQGKQVRITAQLIKVDDGFHLWSQTFDRQLENIFAVQEEIATAIATVLVGELGLEVATVPNQTLNMEAYDMYLQGRALLRVRDDRAVEMLEDASKADPGFAPSWAVLAIAYQVGGQPDKAIQSANKALQLDPDNVDALDAMASVLRSKMRWQEAEVYFDRALVIDPQSSELLEDYAEFLAKVGRTKAALKVTTRGYAIDPNLLPLALAHTEALLSNGYSEQALQLIEEIATAMPDDHWLRWEGLPVYLSQSNYSLDDEMLGNMDLLADMLPILKAILADPTDQSALAQLKTWITTEIADGFEYYLRVSTARRLLAWAGETDEVLDFDLAAMRLSEVGIAEWGWTPLFKAVRQNPRYEQFLQQAGLIQYWDATTWPDWCRRNNDGKVVCK